MPDEEIVKLFISSGCGPCQEVRKMIEEGKHNLGQNIEIVDVATEAGFPFIAKLGLVKVPTALKGEKVCDILSDGESLLINCPGDNNPPAENLQE